jgi:hypothetical protein
MDALRCPVCKAENTYPPLPFGGEGRGEGARVLCRRCKADLSLLFQLEEARQQLLEEAQHEANVGHWQQFLSCVSRAHALRGDDQTRHLRALGCLLTADFAGAMSESYNLASGGRQPPV